MEDNLNEEPHPTDKYIFWGDSHKESIEKRKKNERSLDFIRSGWSFGRS